MSEGGDRISEYVRDRKSFSRRERGTAGVRTLTNDRVVRYWRIGIFLSRRVPRAFLATRYPSASVRDYLRAAHLLPLELFTRDGAHVVSLVL